MSGENPNVQQASEEDLTTQQASKEDEAVVEAIAYLRSTRAVLTTADDFGCIVKAGLDMWIDFDEGGDEEAKREVREARLHGVEIWLQEQRGPQPKDKLVETMASAASEMEIAPESTRQAHVGWRQLMRSFGIDDSHKDFNLFSADSDGLAPNARNDRDWIENDDGGAVDKRVTKSNDEEAEEPTSKRDSQPPVRLSVPPIPANPAGPLVKPPHKPRQRSLTNALKITGQVQLSRHSTRPLYRVAADACDQVQLEDDVTPARATDLKRLVMAMFTDTSMRALVEVIHKYNELMQVTSPTFLSGLRTTVAALEGGSTERSNPLTNAKSCMAALVEYSRDAYEAELTPAVAWAKRMLSSLWTYTYYEALQNMFETEKTNAENAIAEDRQDSQVAVGETSGAVSLVREWSTKMPGEKRKDEFYIREAVVRMTYGLDRNNVPTDSDTYKARRTSLDTAIAVGRSLFAFHRHMGGAGIVFLIPRDTITALRNLSYDNCDAFAKRIVALEPAIKTIGSNLSALIDRGDVSAGYPLINAGLPGLVASEEDEDQNQIAGLSSWIIATSPCDTDSRGLPTLRMIEPPESIDRQIELVEDEEGEDVEMVEDKGEELVDGEEEKESSLWKDETDDLSEEEEAATESDEESEARSTNSDVSMGGKN